MRHLQTNHRLKRVVNRSASVRPFRDCARSRPRGPQSTKGEKCVTRITCWPRKEGQPVLRSNFVLILYLVQVNTAKANVTNLQLSIMKRSNFRGQVPLPGIASICVQFQSQAWPTT